MPFSIVHIEIWTKLKNYLLSEDNFLDFLAWSIFVDSSYNLKELWVKIDREVTHYYQNESFISSDFPKNFYDSELNNWFSYFKLWYYYHLILDKLWRDSKFVWDCYKDVDKENLYQLSRIIYSKYDLDAFIADFWTSIIDKLYMYEIDKKEIPSIYKGVNSSLLQETYISIIDYMCNKRYFKKLDWENIIYKIVNWGIEILNKSTENEMNSFFPYKEYINLKNYWFEILKKEIISLKN